MRIYLDVDGVLADWTTQANEWLGLPKNTPWTEYNQTGMDWERLNDAMSYVSFWRDMELISGAKKLLHNLRKLGDVVICTRPFPHENCVFGRTVWLKNNFDIDPKQTIFIHDKWLLAKPEAVLIDDNVENVRLFAEHGGESILFPQSYNTKIVPPDRIESVLNQTLTIRRRLDYAQKGK